MLLLLLHVLLLLNWRIDRLHLHWLEEIATREVKRLLEERRVEKEVHLRLMLRVVNLILLLLREIILSNQHFRVVA